ncbi:hypothetical protein F5Y14DRAFT_439998 [Nemania sp. NC0429]|nr:hypothetical protein F5Y14DRAFT_439998 [Nemania sp. NC0429]
MSITLTISKSGLKFSRHLANDARNKSDASDIASGKPDLASLDSFASRIRLFQWRDGRTRGGAVAVAPGGAPGTGGERLQSETAQQYSHHHQNTTINKTPLLKGAPAELPNATESPRIIELPSRGGPVGSADPTKSKASRDARDSSPGSTISPGPVAPVTFSLSSLETGQTSLHKTDSARGDSGVADEDQVRSTPTIRGTSSQPLKLSSGSSTIQSKRQEPLGYTRWKPTQVHIPRSKLDRLRRLRIASPTTVKVEDAEFSAAGKEKLRVFSSILASKKDQIELFGKELPLCRVCLVQVREGESPPFPYICVQGLNNAADITRIHSAMSHKRYKPLYDPLKLCYDTSDISHVANLDVGTSQASQDITIEPQGYEDMQTADTYQYKPITGDKTYCGALSRTTINDQTYRSTFGGLVEVDGMIYLMTCQHSVSDTASETIPSLSDTLAESEVPPDSEGPLVFCSGDLLNGPDSQPETSRAADRPPSLGSPYGVDWKDLSVGGAVRKGREWILIPLEDHYILPNLIEMASTKKGKGVGDLEIHYLDETSDPQPGSPSYIITGSTTSTSGVVSAGTSFIIGAGTDGVLGVWTILLDNSRGLRKGDSGAWVVDTSDPLRYKVLGSVIATSHGAAHFVSLKDQFHEMSLNSRHSLKASLAPVFRTLIQCAHIAFKQGDPSAEWFISEALSPQALEQMHRFWCLPAIKVFVNGVPNTEAKADSETKQLQQANVNALKRLLLRYGVNLLDNLPNEQHWLEVHYSELRPLEQKVFSLLAEAAKPYFATATKEAKIEENHALDGSSATCVSGPPENAARHVNFRQNRRENVSGFYIKKKGDNYSALMLLLIIPMVAFAGLAGIAATMALLAAERSNAGGSFHIDIGKAASLGVVSGIISASPMALQIVLIYFSRKVHWSFYLGRNLYSSSFTYSWRSFQGTLSQLLSTTAIGALVIVLSSFARTSLAALYTARVLGIDNQRALFVSSAAAAVPMLLSTASPIISWRIFKSKDGFKYSETTGLWMVSTGFDALAGYTFGRVAQNQGLNFFQPSSGAASFGVFGAIFILWPILSWVPFGPLIFPLFVMWRRRHAHNLNIRQQVLDLPNAELV